MASRSISNEYTFGKLECFVTNRISRFDSRDEVSSNSDMDSRSNSIVDEVSNNENTYTYSDKIPIPSNSRQRELNYDGKIMSDQRSLTPTPTKYYIQIQENMKKIRNLFSKK